MRTCLIASLTFLYLVAFAYGDDIKTLDGKVCSRGKFFRSIRYSFFVSKFRR